MMYHCRWRFFTGEAGEIETTQRMEIFTADYCTWMYQFNCLILLCFHVNDANLVSAHYSCDFALGQCHYC